MNDRLRNILLYTGLFGAIISATAYLIITYIIVLGFESQIDQNKQILFSILGAVDGLLISFLLRSQGKALAEKEPKSEEVMAEYRKLINKNKTIKQMHTINYWMVVYTIIDVFVKGATIGISTWLIIYIFSDGSGNYQLFLLAISNVFMFAGFGIMNLSKIYNKYMREHIPVIESIIEKLKEKDQTGLIQSKEIQNANIQQRKLFITATTSGKEQN